ncbi:MAG: hypothetical protein ASARMPRED_000072 [Alectoria sarmentosa]|nr:MAG: hypothetical protein ASARMPRED_000072 [Alectoria sarmentosa]
MIPSLPALGLPLLSNANLAVTPLNITDPALEEAPVGITNLTYPSWPKLPFTFRLRGPGLLFRDVFLIIGFAQIFEGLPVASATELQHFLQDFAGNIQREHPVPGFVPRHVTQSTIDISSYTRWIVKINEGPLGDRLPTVVALVILEELRKLLRRFGPTSILWAVKDLGVFFPWAYGSLDIDKIVGVSLNKSSSNENGEVQTA